MASFIKRGTRWRAQVYVHGKPKTKSFPSKSHAQAWARMMENDAADLSAGMIPDKTLNDLFDRYSREVSVHKGGERWEYIRLKKFMRDPVAEVRTRMLTPQHIAEWRDRRLTEVQGASVKREMGLMSAVFTMAVKEWGWLKMNPVALINSPKSSPDRTRRPTDDEINALLQAMQFDGDPPVSVGQRLAYAMLFAIETAMRTSEMCALTWGDIHEKLAHVAKSKNGDARNVPLTIRARELLKVLRPDDPSDDALVFNMKPSQVDSNFRKMKKKAKIDDLHFHDFRREGTTRLAKKVDVMTLAKITGHRDVRILLKVYYAPKMDEVADLLD